jgi:hypothetical protein
VQCSGKQFSRIETAFSAESVQRSYHKNNRRYNPVTRVDAGSNNPASRRRRRKETSQI